MTRFSDLIDVFLVNQSGEPVECWSPAGWLGIEIGQEFGGAAPYKLRVGNVSGTKVEWRGSAYDLSARASNNVARVELN